MERKWHGPALLLMTVLAGLTAVTGCGAPARVEGGSAATGTGTTLAGGASPGAGTGTGSTLIDSAAILARYGFETCGTGMPPAGTVTFERGQAILDAAIDAGISSGGSPGSDGYKAMIGLAVLDDRSLRILAGIAQPSEVCVTGQDPNDYVEPGPQTLEGPGWHWVGAGPTPPLAMVGPVGLVTDQAGYDALWPILGRGPETSRYPVDFARQVIVVIGTGTGVNFGSCGMRFDGFEVIDGAVVLDLFTPGGATSCNLPLNSAVYAVALDLERTGPLPLKLEARRLKTRDPSYLGTVGPNSFVTTTTGPPQPVPTTTTIPPTVPPTAGAAPATVAPGQRSVPAFTTRAVPAGKALFDAPAPDGWEVTAAPGSVDVHIVGRGDLSVRTFPAGSAEWMALVGPGREEKVASGPTAVALPVHRRQGAELVTTGETVAAQEYRYTSDTSWVRRTVRWYQRGDTVTVAVVGYPDPAKVPQALTGLDPAALINDIRVLA